MFPREKLKHHKLKKKRLSGHSNYFLEMVIKEKVSGLACRASRELVDGELCLESQGSRLVKSFLMWIPPSPPYS